MAERREYLGEHYRIIESHKGGMGEVFICERIDPSQRDEDNPSTRIALKTFQRRYFFEQAARLSFAREATVWLRLSEVPHVLPVFGTEEIDGRPFLTMLAIEKGPQGERTVADLLRTGPLDPELALRFAFQVALALKLSAVRLKGLVHGDLKAANVLLTGGRAFVADFGLANAAALGKVDTRLGSTRTYRAPELWGERQPLSVSTDVYAYGVMLYEMLAGRLPFVRPADLSSFADAHRLFARSIPADFSDTGLGAAAMQLALACAAVDPTDRPHDFAAVCERLNEIYLQHDPADHLMVLMSASHLKQALSDLPSHDEQRVSSLLRINEPLQALEELDSIPDAKYTAVLWLRRGTALSLLNRDEEALVAFELAANVGLRPDDLISCRVEYALSLKRLRRFEESRAIYEQLMLHVTDEQLPLVVINLATVYLQQEQSQEVISLLEPFVRRFPDTVAGWANLGQAYAFAGRYNDAETAYKHALAAAPQEGRVRTMLAALYMDHMGRLEHAWAALDAAFDAGYEGRDWLVRMLVVSMLLDRRDSVNGLLWGLEHNFEKKLADSIKDEADAMIRRLIEQYSSKSAEVREATPSTEPMEDVEPDAVAESGPVADAEPNPDSRPDPRRPFLNVRFYDMFDFTIDYYDDPASETFLPSFLEQWRRMTMDPRMAIGGATLRGSPFYFTRCPECRVYVLTNRDRGKQIACRMCEHRWETAPIETADLLALVDRASEATGIQAAPPGAVVYALWVQPAKAHIDTIDRLCTAAGFERWRNDQFLALHLMQQATKLGANIATPWGLWVCETTQRDRWSSTATPAPVSELVRKIQQVDPGARTISSSLTPEEAEFMRTNAIESQSEQEQASREAVREGRAEAHDFRNLAYAYRRSGDWKEAQRFAHAAVAADEESAESWLVLGLSFFGANDFVEARAALERALALDPLSNIAIRLLAICCAKLGDEGLARQLELRASTLGGDSLFSS